MPEEIIAPQPFAPQMTPEAPKKRGLFGGKEPLAPAIDTAGMQQDLNTISTRLRVSEERYTDLRRKLQLIEQNMISNHKKVTGDIKALQGDHTETKRTIAEIENKIILLIKELQMLAKKEDVEIIRKYFEMWNPVKLATIEQVERMIQEHKEEKEE